jgi:hypothetical protein
MLVDVAVVGRAIAVVTVPEDLVQIPEEGTDNWVLHTGKLLAESWDREPLHV